MQGKDEVGHTVPAHDEDWERVLFPAPAEGRVSNNRLLPPLLQSGDSAEGLLHFHLLQIALESHVADIIQASKFFSKESVL